MKKNDIFFNRELSWLSFNYRVLQEAKDKSNPLFERIKFLAIYSSNLDEFFRVRVASLRTLLEDKKESFSNLDFNPSKLLKEIHKTVNVQQEEFGKIFRDEILPELENNDIYLTDYEKLNIQQLEFISEYFDNNISYLIQPVLLVRKKIFPFLKNQALYLAVKLKSNSSKNTSKRDRFSYSLVEIPSSILNRFIELPKIDNKNYILFLDDIIKANLYKVFPGYKIDSCYSVKLTRDAELYIDDEFSGDLLAKIKNNLRKRETGAPSRFLYDKEMPKDFLKFLKEALNLQKDDLVEGGKYHNFNDFFKLPAINNPKLFYKPLESITHKQAGNNLFKAVSRKDIALFFPYHNYNHIIKFFEQAASDPKVTEIKVTQYRVAKDSKIIKALIEAKNKGKDVNVFVEVKARFDEDLNIRWAEEMESAGITVHYSFPGLKVHTKLALIKREEESGINSYCYLGTGNFNENTSKIYTDIGLLTKNADIAEEVNQVFDFLMNKKQDLHFNNLLVAQFNIRKDFNRLIDNEIENAKSGKDSFIIAKMNSLEDPKMIKKFYKASNAGVKINLIIRGICCLKPGIKGLSENISVRSIVGRFLEHSRVYVFCNNNDEIIFAGSADLMKRNLNRRIETLFPIYDKDIKKNIIKMITLQLNDNTKARIIDNKQKNKYADLKDESINSQIDFYNLLSS